MDIGTQALRNDFSVSGEQIRRHEQPKSLNMLFYLYTGRQQEHLQTASLKSLCVCWIACLHTQEFVLMYLKQSKRKS